MGRPLVWLWEAWSNKRYPAPHPAALSQTASDAKLLRYNNYKTIKISCKGNNILRKIKFMILLEDIKIRKNGRNSKSFAYIASKKYDKIKKPWIEN